MLQVRTIICIFINYCIFLCFFWHSVPWFLLNHMKDCSLFSWFFFFFFYPLGFLPPGEATCKHIFKIPLCNLVGRSIERPLKSPLVNKVMTAPTPAMIAPAPLISATHSLSLSRMEIKEIASRTRKELLGILKYKYSALQSLHMPWTFSDLSTNNKCKVFHFSALFLRFIIEFRNIFDFDARKCFDLNLSSVTLLV